MVAEDVLKSAFVEVYPDRGEPDVCRAPGRVNLIGEHTDYNGLPVLPMTLSQDMRVAFLPCEGGRIRLQDTDAAFDVVDFANGPSIEPSAPGSWENYCKAAIAGLNRHFKPARYPGLDMLVSGSVPMRAGLSSSSALVVACALAYLRALDKTLDKDISRLALATLLAEAEHYVGTQGGGMDQAVILLGKKGYACKIDFFPLRVEHVPLLPGHVFLVCNSMVAANKTGEAMHRYNAGPRLSKLICALVERQAQDEFGDDEIEIKRLGDLLHGHLCLTNREVEELFDRTFTSPTTTLKEAAARLGTTPQTVRKRWLGDLQEPAGGFDLRSRARHLRTEYMRVEAARDALLGGEPHELARLMNSSHESCAADYQISCPELERLVHCARRCGAMGARLTGAGFGGCTVNLVREDQAFSVMAAIEKDYYRGITTSSAVFQAESSDGAGYL